MNDQSLKNINQLDRETSRRLLHSESICTLTKFTGKVPKSYLQQKVSEIVRLNPWLNGRLVKNQGQITVQYQNVLRNSNTTPNLKFIRESFIKKKDTGDNLDYLLQLSVKKGKSCVNKDLPLFQIIVVEKNEDEFFLIVSLCQILGDHRSFYRIYQMLSKDMVSGSLDINRNTEIVKEMKKRTKPMEKLLINNTTVKYMMSSMLFSPKRTDRNYVVNQDWIKSQKQSYIDSYERVEDIKIISSNDVLTAEFFKASGCKIGLMNTDLRFAINALDENHFGNYESYASYLVEDNKISPAFIRRGLNRVNGLDAQNGKKSNKEKDDFSTPGYLTRSFAKVAVISNWSSLYHDLVFDGCELTLHQPLLDEKTVKTDLGIVYKRNKNQLGMMVFESKNRIKEHFSERGVAVETK